MAMVLQLRNNLVKLLKIGEDLTNPEDTDFETFQSDEYEIKLILQLQCWDFLNLAYPLPFFINPISFSSVEFYNILFTGVHQGLWRA